MRKTISTLILAIMTLSGLSSCQKDYTCHCTTAGGSTYDSSIKTTKKKAKAFCEEQNTATRTCELQ